MRRVVVTGMGVVSCLGNEKESVVDALRQSRPGIRFNDSFAEMGLRSNVSGSVEIDLGDHIDRKTRRFMGDAAAYAYVSMQQAIEDAGLTSEDLLGLAYYANEHNGELRNVCCGLMSAAFRRNYALWPCNHDRYHYFAFYSYGCNPASQS